MGLDQHRAQITAEWIDTSTGEVSRSRVAPAHRAGVRAFVDRFRGEELEVALEATTGWRFVVEELQAIGAHVHLAEPAETAARRGTKKRAKSDRADARHLRELVLDLGNATRVDGDFLLARGGVDRYMREAGERRHYERLAPPDSGRLENRRAVRFPDGTGSRVVLATSSVDGVRPVAPLGARVPGGRSLRVARGAHLGRLGCACRGVSARGLPRE
jgi:hypothetical protein